MSSQPEDDVFNKAQTRYKALLSRRSRVNRVGAFVGNMIGSALASHPDVLFSSQDRVVVIDIKTNKVVLTRTGPDLPAAELLSEVAKDLETLSIRQFRMKWDIAA